MSNSDIMKFQEPVIYQIYPRSFQDSNGDGIGDLPGITSRIPYLAQLGVDMVWLSPVYKSPNDDNGYDISDYRQIMDEFGTLADFDELMAVAQENDIKIMMDLVVNHTSDEHEWFQQARSSRDNKFRDYYIWKDAAGYDDDGTPLPPNNWISAFAPSAWEWDEGTEQFYLHLFSKKQPDLNWDNPTVRQEVYDIMRFWLDKGVAGFRMDVINLISKDPAYPNDPEVEAGGHESALWMAANGPRVHEYLQEMNREVLSKYDVVTVGETPDVSTEDALKYTGFDRDELQMVFQFEHMDVDSNPEGFGKWNDEKFKLVDLKRVLSKWQNDLAGKGWNSLYWNNHDQPRAVSRFGNDSPAWRVLSAKMLAINLHFMQGTPYIYQGEELGMTNVFFEQVEDYDDLEIHNAWREYVEESKLIPPEKMLSFISASGRDNARTPMQWSAEENAGFTTGKPWLGLNPRYKEINAEQAVADEDSIFHFYRRLIELRHSTPLMITGTYELLDNAENPLDEEVYAYLRTGDDESLLVICNFTDRQLTRTFEQLDDSAELLISNYPDDAVETLRPYEGKVYRISNR
ncbi:MULTISPECIES: glycoside hydrolase family 13 protein [Rothia]|uniref:glycoside hydrolase family 13 protein n=1 Tax=Rothia TaxID=32207 RepID=UPI0008333B0E|nr:alpha-glucosidase [Rothia sp. ND6WE1A]